MSLSWRPLHWPLLLFSLWLAGCASAPLQHRQLDLDDAQLAPRVMLDEIPFFPQKAYHCGPASLAMMMNRLGEDVHPDDLAQRVFLEARQGSLQAEMLAATRRQGLLPYLHERSFSVLLNQIEAGHPVLVFENLGFEHYPVWHYAVVIGYDLESQQMVLHSGTTERQRRTFKRFELEWRGGDYWAMTMHRPGSFPAQPEEQRYLEATSGLEQAGRLHAAERAYQAATQRWPRSLVAWLGLGNVRYGMERYREAEEAYRQALAVDADSAAAHHNLAWSLMRQQAFMEAYPHAMKADQMAVDQGAHYSGAMEVWRKHNH